MTLSSDSMYSCNSDLIIFSSSSNCNHFLLQLFLVLPSHQLPTAISLWRSSSGDTSAVCFDCQVDEFHESFGEFGPLTDAHNQVLEKWCSGIPGDGDDDAQMVDGDEEDEDDDQGGDSEGEESEGEESGVAKTNDAAMELEDSDDSEEVTAGWICKKCTFANANNATKCGACDRRKPRR